VPLRYDLIKIFGLHGREAEVIDDEEIWGQIFLHSFFPGVIGPTGQKEPEELDRFGEQNVITQATGLMAERLGEVDFAHASGSIEQDVPPIFCMEGKIDNLMNYQ
jgi:hypothetical protein